MKKKLFVLKVAAVLAVIPNCNVFLKKEEEK